MLDTAEEVLTLANRYGNVGTEIPKCIIASANSYKRIHVGYLCAAAKGSFVIDPAGQIRTCNHSPHIVGNVCEEPWIKDTDYWNKLHPALINLPSAMIVQLTSIVIVDVEK